MKEKAKSPSNVKRSTPHKFSPQEKAKIVDEVDSGLLTPAQATRKYGIRSASNISRWRDQVSRKKHLGPRKRTPVATKRRVAEEVRQGFKTVEEVMDELNIFERKTILNWIDLYCYPDCEMAEPLEKGPQDPKSASLSEHEARLQAELDQARLRILSLETLIEVAEEELGIDIRKKSGTKQPEE